MPQSQPQFYLHRKRLRLLESKRGATRERTSATKIILGCRNSEGIFKIMEIKGKIHLLFEQSGTFKNEFKTLGYEAFDYDIQNNFNEIEKGYEGKSSIFDNISQDDLVIAFYPCIYFCATSQMAFYMTCINYRCLNDEEKIKTILKRSDKRKEYYDRLIKFCGLCLRKNIRLIIENPWSEQTYLKANFIKTPDVVDMNRMRRGDYFKKPTAYFYFNCEPTYGESYQNDKEQKIIMKSKGGIKAGLCSEDRSTISQDYARNWIYDFVLGKTQEFGQQKLF